MHRSVTFIGVAAAIIVAANLPARCLGDEPAATDLAAQTADLAAQPGASTPTIDFVRDVRPILQARCHDCHGPNSQESGFRLHQRQAAMVGGDSGEKAIVPGHPEQSRLVRLVSGGDDHVRMPPEDAGDPLTPEEVQTLARWIAEGASWPAEADLPDARAPHWAWQKPVRPELPHTQQGDWPRNGIDHFVLARLEREGLSPAPEADRYTLARRVYLDLTGLPPSVEQVQAFAADTSPDAYEKFVEQALADPGFGERWARIWLDLARYADSKGYGSDPLRSIWRYRDWVIEALNRNLPYDQFTIEQLAGDLLAEPTLDQLLATAMHRNTMSNDEGGTDDEEFRVAAVKDRIETTMQVWMGLTVGCAKCHSHKFDPITQREYYQLYAFFNQTEDADNSEEIPRLATPTAANLEAIASAEADLAVLEAKLNVPDEQLFDRLPAWEATIGGWESRWQALAVSAASVATPVTVRDGVATTATDADVPRTRSLRAMTKATDISALRLSWQPDQAASADSTAVAASTDSATGQISELRILARSSAGAGAVPIAGRYLRVELPGAERILSLAEVELYSAGTNVAKSSTAQQSSTDSGGSAARAVDGNTSGNYDEESVTHTKQEANPWWECDLGEAKPLERIVLFNRRDHGLQDRLGLARVQLLDGDRNVVWQRTLDRHPGDLRALQTAAGTELVVRRVTVEHAQPGEDASALVNGVEDSVGWRPGTTNNVVVELAHPVGYADGTELECQLVESGAPSAGGWRLSVATGTPAPRAVPVEIATILATASGVRTDDQRLLLVAHFRQFSPEFEDLRAQIDLAGKNVANLKDAIPTTPVLRELAADKQRITRMMIKGNFLQVADNVQAAVPVAFHAWPDESTNNRLGLARWIMHPDNPLTARVAVNRFWAQIFGTGLVETEEDFGTQGTPPVHPELLDWLAVEFRDGGWDMKALLKAIVTSSAYRQSSQATAELLAKDPINRLISRGPKGRLEAEMVRDQALAAAGLLSPKQGGPSVYPPQPDGLWRAAFNGERTWPTSQGEDRYRRGLYTFWRRTVPYPSMTAFDAPSREICTIRRISTNTPLQAFVTLNDPVYVEAAQALARRIVSEGGSTTASRAEHGLWRCLLRPPNAEQVASLVELYEKSLARFGQDAESAVALATEPLGPLPEGASAAEHAAWTVVANVLLNLDGMLTKR